MPVHLPTSVDEALAVLADHPDAMLLAGGTDAMVEINDGHLRPPGHVVLLTRIPELRSWRHDPATRSVRIGAAVTYSELMREPLGSLVPALAEASRTVGSPQIRNAGTLGGNIGTCSPAGDGLPVLAALDATVSIAGAGAENERTIPLAEVMVGVKRTVLGPGEMITAVHVPVLDGWQGYAKVGVRNAMVIAVASACLAVDTAGRNVRIALGSVAPTVIRCPEAEAALAAAVDWDSGSVGAAAVDAFGAAVSAASRPITDHRSTADYRRHAVGVLARRLARRAFTVAGHTSEAAA